MEPGAGRHAVVLLSGGLDSATTLAAAVRAGWVCHALSFDYGQRHGVELEAARRLATALGAVEHRVLRLDLSAFGGSALTDPGIAVPELGATGDAAGGIPVTYVPARNTVFLAMALAWAETLGAHDIYIGANAVDYSGYPDCRPEFLAAFEAMANLATRLGVEAAGVEGAGVQGAGVEGQRIRIRAPLVDLGKADIVRLALASGVDPALTVSCYQADAEGRACGRCDSCRLRAQGFVQAGRPDSTRYAPAAPAAGGPPD
ncbi:MAG: 7-cyano-7-deazaguanine synthase [Rhodocyclaceae bacterium]|nr:7-cyano-7-deazaguanine synthase [Rhodocyclaceae bacterium]